MRCACGRSRCIVVELWLKKHPAHIQRNEVRVWAQEIHTCMHPFNYCTELAEIRHPHLTARLVISQIFEASSFRLNPHTLHYVALSSFGCMWGGGSKGGTLTVVDFENLLAECKTERPAS